MGLARGQAWCRVSGIAGRATRLHAEGRALDRLAAERDHHVVQAGDGHRVLDGVRAVRVLRHQRVDAGAAVGDLGGAVVVEGGAGERDLEVVAARRALVAVDIAGDDGE